MPAMYDDLWTAAKGMYKLEPAVADGGEVVIYAPHITEVSYTHGRLIDEIGYHCRDYFLAQWDRFGHYPGGVLAHSTHVKGLGTLRRGDRRRDAAHPGDAGDGHPGGALPADQPRLPGPGRASGSTSGRDARPRACCVVPRAGEMLYRRRRRRPAASAELRHAAVTSASSASA